MIDLSNRDGTLTRWSLSSSDTRKLAVKWALELASKNPGDELESISSVAARYNVKKSMVTSARMQLMGLGLVGSMGGRFYVAQPQG
jgi:DNA-binding IscR family transcriptional regulator